MSLIVGGSDNEQPLWVRRDGDRERLHRRLNRLAAEGKDYSSSFVRETLHELDHHASGKSL